MSRANNFLFHKCWSFFNRKKNLKFKMTAERIYNCDETGLATITTPTNVIVERDIKQAAKVVPTERGHLVTIIGFINAVFNIIPLIFIFKLNKEFMLNRASFGSLGLAYTSGWMTETNFHKALQHFVHHSKPNIASVVKQRYL